MALSLLLVSVLTALPAQAATVSNIAGGYANGGATFAKQGDTLTLTINTTANNNKCVYVEDVTNPASPVLLGSVWSNGSPQTFSFSFVAGAGNGVRNLRATPTKQYVNKVPGTNTSTPNTGTDPTNYCDGNANETVATASYTLDNTVPVISGSHAPAPGKPAAQNGWYRDDVLVSFACMDSGSGIASCTANETLTGQGPNISRTGTARDNLGNTNTATVGGINIDRTAPLTTADAPSGWQRSSVTVTLSPSDNLSGVASTEYRLDGGPWVTGTSIQLGEGRHALSYRSTDRAGNVEAEKTALVDIDLTAPTINSSQDPAKNTAGWNNQQSVTVSFVCTDPLSGIASCAGPQQVTAEGTTPVTGDAVDEAGNTNSVVHPVSIDRTPPTVSGAQSPPKPASGWNTTDVSVNFTCDDDRSGVVACSDAVTFGQGAGQSAAGSATDNAGNTDEATVAGINVDKTAPTTSSNAVPDWQSSDFVLRFTASDQPELSGVSSTEYRLVGAGWTEGDSVTLGEGSHTVLFRSTDVAGNVEQHKTANVNVDKTAPATTSDAPSGWQQQPVTVTFTPTDAGSGVARTEHSLDGTTWTAGTSVLLGHGNHNLRFRSADHVGNGETTKSVPVLVDLENPAVTISGPASTATGSATVTGSAGDSGSGVAGVTVNGATVTLTNGAFSTSAALECGSNTVTAVVTDGVSRTHSASTTIERTCVVAVPVWTHKGFHAPIGESNTIVQSPTNGTAAAAPTATTTTVWNTAKGGSTIPLKFNVSVDGVERTSVGPDTIKTFNATKIPCPSGSFIPDAVEELSSAGTTSLRYVDGHYIQNWKTPTVAADTCYRVALTTADNSGVYAFFRLRK